MREAQLGDASASILNHTCENLIWFNDLLNVVLNARQTIGYTKQKLATRFWNPLALMEIFAAFSSRGYLCAQKSPYALYPVSQKFPQRCL